MPSCEQCKGCETERFSVPMATVEVLSASHERTVKRLWIALILSFLLFMSSYLIWMRAYDDARGANTPNNAEQTTAIL